MTSLPLLTDLFWRGSYRPNQNKHNHVKSVVSIDSGNIFVPSLPVTRLSLSASLSPSLPLPLLSPSLSLSPSPLSLFFSLPFSPPLVISASSVLPAYLVFPSSSFFFPSHASLPLSHIIPSSVLSFRPTSLYDAHLRLTSDKFRPP